MRARPGGFTGEWQDPAGLVYLRARWYNASLGAFTQPDPEPGIVSSPASQYAYAYAGANPLSFADPTGCEGRRPPLAYRNYSEAELREVAEAMASIVYAEGVDQLRNMSLADKICVMWLFVNGLKDHPEWTLRQVRGAFATREGFIPGEHAGDVRLAYVILLGLLPDPTGGAYFMVDDTQFRECYGKGHEAELRAQALIDSLKLRGAFTMWVEYNRTAHGLGPQEYRNDDRNLEVTRERIGHYFYKRYDPSQDKWPEWARGSRTPCPPREVNGE